MMNPDLTVAAEGELYEDALRCQNEELDEDDDEDDEDEREFDEMAHFRCMLPY